MNANEEIVEKGTTISHYTILEKLGEGGMGVVYKAHDSRLERSVALKFLPPHISQSETERKRFLYEARAASALDHPNICTIHEISETPDGRLYMVMPAYEGQTLDRLLESGPVSEEKAIDIITQVCCGLKAAHEKGIIHRDIKCSNIFLTHDGRVLIMDFGLATRRDVTQITQEDSTIGTVLYMSPEQARGGELDKRTDIWSLGVVFYELITGRQPFRAEYDQAVIYKILNDDPQPVSERAPAVPSFIQTIIDGCLQKDMDTRYGSVEELEKELHRLQTDEGEKRNGGHFVRRIKNKLTRPVVLIPSFASALLILISMFWLLGSSPVIPFEERDWVLITNFENETGEEIFDRSLNTALNASLGQSKHINIFPEVRLPEVLQRMERSEADEIDEQLAIEICIREGLNGLIMPQISRVGGQYSLSIRLIDPETGMAVRSYSESARNQDEILPVLDEIISNIRRDLGESLFSIRTNDREILKVTTPSLQALKYYSDGVHHWSSGNYDEATELQLLALELDPEFASAHAALGIHYYSYIYNDAERGREHFEKALEYSDRASERERMFIRASFQNELGKTDEAERLYRLYLDSFPDDWRVRFNLARLYMTSDRPERAVNEYEEVLRLVPDYPGALINLATSHTINNNYQEALNYYNRAFEQNPDYYSMPNIVHEYGMTLVKSGSRTEARHLYNQLIDTGIRARGLRSLALIDMYEGKFSDARPKLEDAILGNNANNETLSEARDRVFLAILLNETGDFDSMINELDEAHRLLNQTGQPIWMLGNISKLYARSGNIDKASSVLQELSDLMNPDAPSDRSLYLAIEGEIELAKGNYTEAINKFLLSYRTIENNIAGYGLAYTHYLAGNYQESVNYYESYLESTKFGTESQQDWLWAHYHCAMAYDMLDQQEKAKEILGQFLDLWNDSNPETELLILAENLNNSL